MRPERSFGCPVGRRTSSSRRAGIDAIGVSALASGFSVLFPFSCLFLAICLGDDGVFDAIFFAAAVAACGLSLVREAAWTSRALEWTLFVNGLRVLSDTAIDLADARYGFFDEHTFHRAHPPDHFFEVVVQGPMLEEQVFRGVLVGFLALWLPEIPAILLSAALFAVIHPYGAAGNGVVFVNGVCFGLAWRRGGCTAATVLHALANLTAWSLYTGLVA